MSRVRLHGLTGDLGVKMNGREAVVLSRTQGNVHVRVVHGARMIIPAANVVDVTLPGEEIDVFGSRADGPATPRPRRKIVAAL